MTKVNIESLLTYPVKSLKGYSLNKVSVLATGFELDRYFAFLSEENKVITAREIPELLLLKTSVKDDVLQIDIPENKSVSVDIFAVEKELIEAVLFKSDISVQKITHPVNDLVSAFLKQKVSLATIESTLLRPVKEKYNGKPNDVIALSDAAPIHLINRNSVEFLNTNLTEEIPELQFRPNIVVSGVSAFEEENWKYIKIGNCEFEVITKTQRCSLITINMNNAQKSENQEPLRTLSKIKKDKKVNFGIYLVPRKLGTISVNDNFEVIS